MGSDTRRARAPPALRFVLIGLESVCVPTLTCLITTTAAAVTQGLERLRFSLAFGMDSNSFYRWYMLIRPHRLFEQQHRLSCDDHYHGNNINCTVILRNNVSTSC